MGLYEQALGEDFARLGKALRDFHSRPGACLGHLNVTHSKRAVPRFFVWLMQLPAEGVALETFLEVSQEGESETWRRSIGSAKLVTRQKLQKGRLVEQAGPLELLFDVRAEGQAMAMHSYRSKILGIPLPNHIAPFINARAEPFEGGWDVDVDIQCPRYGTICSYTGKVRIV